MESPNRDQSSKYENIDISFENHLKGRKKILHGLTGYAKPG